MKGFWGDMLSGEGGVPCWALCIWHDAYQRNDYDNFIQISATVAGSVSLYSQTMGPLFCSIKARHAWIQDELIGM
jgi:hypothetical protein